jgi:tRNA A-37 threonylcarbamoyl transferase component Bud32
MSAAIEICKCAVLSAKPAEAGPAGFEDHWRLTGELLEEPNRRRGGWSRAERVDGYQRPGDAAPITICIKKQHNHKRYSLAHPFGILTCANEVAMMDVFRRLGIGVPEVAFFETSGKRAVLATVFLESHTSLTMHMDRWRMAPASTGHQRRRIIAKLARTTRRMHDGRVMHYSLYPKHIFLRDGDFEPCLIDLELSKRCWLRRSCALRDLGVLNRHSPSVSRTDKLRFLLVYAGQRRVCPEVRSLWRAIGSRWRAPGQAQ